MLKKGLSLITTTLILLLTVSGVNTSAINVMAKEPVEILSLRSEYGKHFDNGDGTITAYVSTVPIHYWQEDKWIEINNSLILDENGNYTNKSNSLNVTVPSQLSVNNYKTDKENAIQLEYGEFDISVSLTNLSINETEKITSANLEYNVQTSDNVAKANTIDYTQTDSLDDNIPLDVTDSFNDITSSATFESVYNNSDLSIDIQPKSVTEAIIFNSFEDIPDSLTYFIKADGLHLEHEDSNSIDFSNDNGESVFEIPAISMHDSSGESKSFAVDYEISDSNDGYLLTIYPTSNNLINLETSVYPLTLSSEYTVERSVNTYCNSEYSPNEIIRDQYMYISNVNGHGYQTYVTCNDSFTSYGRNATILDAKFNIFLRGNYINSSKHIKIYSLQSEPMNCTWNNSSTLDKYNTLVGGFDVVYTEMNSWKEIDITALTQAWLNYGNSSRNIGIPCYGFKMVADSAPYAAIVANSERAGSNKPYFEITYSLSSNYTLDYAPYKYNNITSNLGNISNFQNRMNCYAYALQTYYNGDNMYYLYPGEFGIGQNIENDGYAFSKFSELSKEYSNFERKIEYAIDEINDYREVYTSQIHGIVNNNSQFEQCMNEYMTFIKNQMIRDGKAINFTLKEYDKTKVLNSKNNSFSPPSGYNENNERIIAMTAYYLYYGRFNGSLSMHYYLRNGNGTCPTHGGNCSIWSQKMGNGKVTNVDSKGIALCDQTIYNSAYNIGSYNMASSDGLVKFYSITKNTDIYGSAHGYGHGDSAGTPYYGN